MNNDSNTQTTKWPERFPGIARAHRERLGRSLVRLKDDLVSASREPVFRAGDTVEASWCSADRTWSAGWQVIGCGFSVRLQPDEVEVVD